MIFFDEGIKTTNNNHIISRFFQKQFGINYYVNNDCKPVFYNPGINKSYVPSGKEWNIKKQYQDYNIFTQDTESSFNDNEIYMGNLYQKGKFKDFLESKKGNFVSFYEKLEFSKNKINKLINEEDMEGFSEFYKSIFERYILSNSFNNNEDCKKVIDETIKEGCEVFREDIEKEFYNDTNKAKRILIQEGRKYAQLFEKFKQSILLDFKKEEFIIICFNQPIFPLTELSFFTECDKDKNQIKVLMCPINSYAIFINNNWFTNNFNDNNKFIDFYKINILRNRQEFMFSSLENKNFYFNFDISNILDKDYLLSQKILNSNQNKDINEKLINTIKYDIKHEKSWWSKAKDDKLICWEGARILSKYDIYIIIHEQQSIFYTVNGKNINILYVEENIDLVIEMENFFNEIKKNYVMK